MKDRSNSFYNKYTKRFLDFVFSLVMLMILLPILLFIVFLIKITSNGPALFKTKRIGINGEEFKFYKFRSMKVDAPNDLHPKYIDSEKYVTKIGRLLRKSSLDELPQLYCVLKGDMSIVGPRPSGKSETELNYLRQSSGVFKLRPGITGLAQINGRNKLANNDFMKNELDVKYLSKISFKTDLLISLKTIVYVIRQRDIE